jgi:hypothetical protein
MLRTILWETDEIAAYAGRAILGHPQLELVGAFTSAEGGHGRDLAELLGIDGYKPVERTRVQTTAKRDEIFAMPADCVVHCPAQERDPSGCVDDICRLLASGKNVSSTALMHLIHPRAMPSETRGRIEEACANGKTTFHATGINPGFFAELLPAMLSGVTSDVRAIAATEYHSYAGNPSQWIVVEHVGMGRPLEYKKAKIVNRAALMARASMETMADALGLKIDDVTFDAELYAAEEPVQIAATRIEPGTFAGSWYRFAGIVRGEKRLEMNFIHRAAPHVAPRWPKAPAVPTCWQVEIDSVPKLVNTTVLSVEHGLPTYAGAGMRAANAVPAVCAAPPGIRTGLDLRVTGWATPSLEGANRW